MTELEMGAGGGVWVEFEQLTSVNLSDLRASELSSTFSVQVSKEVVSS
jgi:hypothetical protein